MQASDQNDARKNATSRSGHNETNQKDLSLKNLDDAKSESNDPQIPPEKIDLLCKLRSAKTSVPMNGIIQVFVTKSSPFLGMMEKNVAWIKSSYCPEGYYSIVHYSDDGDVTKEIDCRRASLTELNSLSGEQSQINDAFSNETTSNIAISGIGYFVLQCPDNKLILTRNGQFKKSASHQLSNEDNCILLDTNGRPFADQGMSRDGCNPLGQCIATLDPAFDEIEGLKYLNSFSFQARAAMTPELSMTRKGPELFRPRFYSHSLENINDSERGLTSVSWINHPSVNLDELECP